jgi:hypothetical protein
MTERTGLGETYLVSAANNYLITPSRYENEGYIPARDYRSAGIDRALRGEDSADTCNNYQTPPKSVVGALNFEKADGDEACTDNGKDKFRP